KSALLFKAQGIISQILVKNGSYVKKDQKVAMLDSNPAQLKLLQAQERMEKANLDFADKLIGYGYGRDTASVPADLLRVIKIQSGYNQTVNDLRQAQEDLENTILRAPFSGKIANIEGRAYEPNSGEFCTLIDDSKFEVEFSLLESELTFIRTGNTVKVSSFSEPTLFYQGLVTQINPVVDDKGQIKVMAQVNNSSGKLMEGMNVKVIAQSLLHGHLVVPKSAVVMRDNFDVLFRLDATTGKAMWTYVNVLMTNTESHSVVANKEKNATLDEGDIIIVAGNLNLADGSNVEIKE
ncbi:MAG: efflux RND transporter periplasmic adaptor subunit, partial [Bacteroidales bacterium]